MLLHIQDPLYQSTTYLVEILLQSCERATRGGGAFAFASSDGVRLLLRDPTFEAFATQRRFDLIVGVDAITDEAALHALTDAASHLPKLRVRIFLHDRRGIVFHPKICWFRTRRGGVLIAGSGNLTVGGLRGNWEAFTVTSLNSSDVDAIERSWTDWIERSTDQLFAMDDAKVLERARKNRRPIEAEGVERPPAAEAAGSPPRPTDEVLIAQIPRGGSRWNQANFDIRTFEDFFRLTPGALQRVHLYRVASDGSLSPPEIHPGVAVKSRNYRLELEAGTGLPYPASGRPIGIFVREAVRTFRYQLLMPSDPDYQRVDDFLSRTYSGPVHRVRRVIIDARALNRAWPNCPLLK